MAKLREKSNGTYFIDYRVDGKRKRKSVGKSKRIAELALKDLEVKLARNELGFEAKDSTIQKLLFEYQKYCQTNVSPGSQKRYRAISDNFKRFLSSEYSHLTKLSTFTPKVFEDFKGFRQQEGAQNRTINNELAMMKLVFRLAIQWGFANENPTDKVSKLKVQKKNAPKFFTKEECVKLVEACDDWFKPIVVAFLNSGMRKGELENLYWEDIDWKRNRILIRQKDGWRPKTSERQIPINARMKEVLLSQKKTKSSPKYVFPDKRGNKIYENTLLKKMKSLVKQLNLGEVNTIHALRHTFASHLVMNGVDLTTVKEIMGHSDIETTMIYSHLTKDHVDDAVSKLKF